ncbi:hypothetical protein [Nocardioides donggukensis]|uniref:Uncharacterized protein n=1 Tax=Nocardioides donggukensis TaxID=2774019 RepID=A0A927Q0F6_9ACTN|nr:hypothetical protein [Nocardioides donggukensis]MBD8870585.1 hypothetical protein [Nocardioides donggukensis]
MPKSRNREKRNRSHAERRRARERRDRAGRRLAAETAEEFRAAHPLTAEEHRHFVLTAAAEAAGDAERAWLHCSLVGRFAGTERERRLRQLADLTPTAPGWVWSRWVLEQACRDVSDAAHERQAWAVDGTVRAAYGEWLRPGDGGIDPLALLLEILARDWVYRQLFLYDGGGLRHFLDTGARAPLLARSDRIDGWSGAPMGGYRLLGESATRVVFRDLETREDVEVPNIGTASELCPGEHSIGRLVPISTESGLMFESAPMPVPGSVARAVAAAPDHWLDSIGVACRADQLPSGFSRRLHHPLVTDVPMLAWRFAAYPSTEEAVAAIAGTGAQRIVDDAVRLCRLALLRLEELHRGGDAAWPLLGAALLEPGVVRAVRGELVAPEYAAAWARLADLLVEPARGTCLRLAEECRPWGDAA